MGWKAALGLIEKLIRPLMLALGLWKAKEAGRMEEQRDALERELDAADNAKAARDALSDDDVRDELQQWREQR